MNIYIYAENINFALWEINQYVNQSLDILTPDQQHEANLISKVKMNGYPHKGGH